MTNRQTTDSISGAHEKTENITRAVFENLNYFGYFVKRDGPWREGRLKTMCRLSPVRAATFTLRLDTEGNETVRIETCLNFSLNASRRETVEKELERAEHFAGIYLPKRHVLDSIKLETIFRDETAPEENGDLFMAESASDVILAALDTITDFHRELEENLCCSAFRKSTPGAERTRLEINMRIMKKYPGLDETGADNVRELLRAFMVLTRNVLNLTRSLMLKDPPAEDEDYSPVEGGKGTHSGKRGKREDSC